MDALERFAGKLKARLAEAETAPKLPASEFQQYMTEFEPRLKRFEELSAHLITDVIRPRVLQLGSFFSNARIDRMQHPVRCILWFNYCDRFPANVKLEFSLEHDERVENLIVLYQIGILPTFLKFDAHDKVALPFASVRDEEVAAWVEAKILDFVETYLQIDRGSPEANENLTTDPVCGMRFSQLDAAAQSDYLGHPYFFCSDDCYRKFVADPTQFVLFRINA